MPNSNSRFRQQALTHFEEARRKAARDQFSAWLTGRESHLLPFEVIRSQLKQRHPLYRGIHQIPVPRILGSVGRCQEFTRSFLPLNDALKERWIEIESLAMSRGWPPIEVYQVGDAYFVQDGNHRVSVARQMGNDTIEAHVYEFPAEEIVIPPDATLDELLIRFGEHNFMATTKLDQLRPDHNICFTVPGRYRELLAQIHDLRDKLSLIDGEEISYEEAVIAWYEMIYLPIVQIIHDSTLLADFPGRTEADLFGWLSVHRSQLSDLYGDYDLAALARILAEKYKEGKLDRIARRLRRFLGGDKLPPLEGV